MAVYIRCDGGCGKESPDHNYLHIANKWIQVTTEAGSYFKTKKEFSVCEDCFRDKAIPQYTGG